MVSVPGPQSLKPPLIIFIALAYFEKYIYNFCHNLNSNRGKRPFTNLNGIIRDTNICLEDLTVKVENKEKWLDVVKTCSAFVT